MKEHEPTLEEAINACRPGSDDWTFPELRHLSMQLERDPSAQHLYRRCQQFDLAVANALKDVLVPDDLEERLIALIGVEGMRTESPGSNVISGTDSASLLVIATDKSARSSATRPAQSRRMMWLIVGFGVAVSLCVAFFAGVNALVPRGPIPLEQLADEVRQVWTVTSQEPWREDWGATAHRPYPKELSTLLSPSRWRRLVTRFDADAVVYDLRANQHQPFVGLVVLRSDSQFAVGPSIRVRPQWTTGGWCLGASQRGHLVYVLIVEGDEERYQRVVQPGASLASAHCLFARLADA